LSSSSRHDQAFSIGTSFREGREGEIRAEARAEREVERAPRFIAGGTKQSPTAADKNSVAALRRLNLRSLNRKGVVRMPEP